MLMTEVARKLKFVVCSRNLGWLALAVICWTLVDPAGARPTTESNPETRTSGLLFQPAGQLVMATGRWTLVVRLDDKEIGKQKDKIRAQIAGITDALADTRRQLPKGGHGGREEEELQRMSRFYGAVERSWMREKEWMLHEMNAAERRISGVLRGGNQRRRTRGLIPFIGAGLKFLFGTATEEETTRLHKEVKGVQVEAGRLRHIQKLQATLIGRLAKEERQGRRDLHALANKTNQIISMMASSRDQSRAVHRHLRQEVDVTRAVGAAARTAGAAVLTFKQEAEVLTRAMAHAQDGRLVADIISPRAMEHALSAVRTHLPNGWTLALPDSLWARQGFGGLTVSTVPLSEGFEVHIRIPLAQTEVGRFELYRVAALPSSLSNRSVGVRTETAANWFAITPNQRFHLELGGEDLEQCQRTEGWVSCENLPRAIQEGRDGCLYQAFRRNEVAAKRSCTRRVVPLRWELKRIGRQHWAYTFPNEEAVYLQCGDRVADGSLRLQGTGVVEVPSGCAAVGDHFLIPAHLEGGQTVVEGPQLEDMAIFDTTTSLKQILQQVGSAGDEKDTRLDVALIEISDRLPDEAIVNSTIEQVSEALKNDYQATAAHDDAYDWRNGLKEHGPLTLSTIGIVGLMAYAVRACVQRRGGDRQRGDSDIDSSTKERISTMQTKLQEMSDVVIRLAKLEERVEGHTRDVEMLKKFM